MKVLQLRSQSSPLDRVLHLFLSDAWDLVVGVTLSWLLPQHQCHFSPWEQQQPSGSPGAAVVRGAFEGRE